MAEERPGARQIAIETLLRVERDRAWADATLSGVLDTAALDTRDRALATRLVYGTLAWQGLLDWHIGNLANRKVPSLDAPLRVILRMGLYQILLLERIPPHAAVDTSVDLAKRYVRAAAGMVNAVLRRALRERATLSMPDPADTVRYLSVTTSHPEWLVREWQRDFSPTDLHALLTANNQAAPTVLRARPDCRDRLLADLASAGVSATAGRFAPDAVRIDDLGKYALPAVPPEHGTLQSEASQLVATLLGSEPGLRVLDACAAPGGKAAYLADLAGDRALVVAVERHPRRAAAVRRTAHRLGLRSLVSVAADARTCGTLFRGTIFDRILVDAPCTGLGTLPRSPGGTLDADGRRPAPPRGPANGYSRRRDSAARAWGRPCVRHLHADGGGERACCRARPHAAPCARTRGRDRLPATKRPRTRGSERRPQNVPPPRRPRWLLRRPPPTPRVNRTHPPPCDPRGRDVIPRPCRFPLRQGRIESRLRSSPQTLVAWRRISSAQRRRAPISCT